MQDYEVIRYSHEHYSEWNSFILKAKNSTFLFHRDFIEYHKDRFEDFSLMIYRGEKLMAVLPANTSGDIVFSHQGLTYGGVLIEPTMSALKVFDIYKSINDFLIEKGVTKFIIKQIPIFYCKRSSSEITYLLGKKSNLTDRQMVLAIDYSKDLHIHKTKLKHQKKEASKEFKIIENDSLSLFWKTVLEPRLLEKHNAKPVHTIEEIKYLQNRFPENIKQYNIYKGDQILAGITIFETEHVVKSQYGATTSTGEKLRALEYLFLHLIEKYRIKKKHFFSMGTVSEDNLKGYNEGLLKQKEELGCSVYLLETFNLDLA